MRSLPPTLRPRCRLADPLHFRLRRRFGVGRREQTELLRDRERRLPLGTPEGGDCLPPAFRHLHAAAATAPAFARQREWLIEKSVHALQQNPRASITHAERFRGGRERLRPLQLFEEAHLPWPKPSAGSEVKTKTNAWVAHVLHPSRRLGPDAPPRNRRPELRRATSSITICPLEYIDKICGRRHGSPTNHPGCCRNLVLQCRRCPPNRRADR